MALCSYVLWATVNVGTLYPLAASKWNFFLDHFVQALLALYQNLYPNSVFLVTVTLCRAKQDTSSNILQSRKCGCIKNNLWVFMLIHAKSWGTKLTIGTMQFQSYMLLPSAARPCHILRCKWVHTRASEHQKREGDNNSYWVRWSHYNIDQTHISFMTAAVLDIEITKSDATKVQRSLLFPTFNCS